MLNCPLCGKEIYCDSVCINGHHYHSECVSDISSKLANLIEENERLKEIHKLNELICEIAKYDTNQIKITRKKLEECLFTIREVEEMKNWLKESELDYENNNV